MSTSPYFAVSGMSLTLNGARVALVQSFSVNCLTERKAVCGFGDGVPSGFAKGKTVYEVTLRRAAQIKPAVGDGLDLPSLEDFTAELICRGYKTTFTGCQWKRIAEGGAPGTPVFEEMVFVASGRSRTAL